MNMIQTVIIEAETPAKLTMALNDWLKKWDDDRILSIQYSYKDKHHMSPYSVLVAYQHASRQK